MFTRARKTFVAIARNQAHRLLGGATRGGHRTREWSAEERAAHARGIYDTLAPHVGDVTGRSGLEIGPGDNLDVAGLFVAAGATHVHAIERFARPTEIPDGVFLMRDSIERITLPRHAVHFAYANDVFEHVTDIAAAYRSIYRCLAPGGVFVNSIDLRGHNSYRDPIRPLEHHTCPAWLYRLMHSHVVTSNRCHQWEFQKAALAAGFHLGDTIPLAVADLDYLADLAPRLRGGLRRGGLPPDVLGVLQLLQVLRKPAWKDR